MIIEGKIHSIDSLLPCIRQALFFFFFINSILILIDNENFFYNFYSFFFNKEAFWNRLNIINSIRNFNFMRIFFSFSFSCLVVCWLFTKSITWRSKSAERERKEEYFLFYFLSSSSLPSILLSKTTKSRGISLFEFYSRYLI